MRLGLRDLLVPRLLTPGGADVGLGSERGPTGREALFPQWFTLAEWLDRWVSGRLYQPLLVWDLAMWQWRSATDEEWAQQLAELDDPM